MVKIFIKTLPLFYKSIQKKMLNIFFPKKFFFIFQLFNFFFSNEFPICIRFFNPYTQKLFLNCWALEFLPPSLKCL